MMIVRIITNKLSLSIIVCIIQNSPSTNTITHPNTVAGRKILVIRMKSESKELFIFDAGIYIQTI